MITVLQTGLLIIFASPLMAQENCKHQEQLNAENASDQELIAAGLCWAARIINGEKNLVGAYLNGADLRGMDLAGFNFRKAALIGTDFTGANLYKVDFTGAFLVGALLNNADLRGVGLTDANLTYAKLSGARLNNADLTRAKLSYSISPKADFTGAKLNGADMTGADLNGAQLNGADLRGADLSGAQLNGANLNGANLSDAKLRGASLVGSKLRGANLSNVDFSGVSFRLRIRILRVECTFSDDGGVDKAVDIDQFSVSYSMTKGNNPTSAQTVYRWTGSEKEMNAGYVWHLNEGVEADITGSAGGSEITISGAARDHDTFGGDEYGKGSVSLNLNDLLTNPQDELDFEITSTDFRLKVVFEASLAN